MQRNLWSTTEFDAPSRQKRHWEFAEKVKNTLDTIFGPHGASVAATARFEVQGPGSEGQNKTAWAHAIRTRIQSHKCPSIAWLGSPRGTWFSGNSEESAELVLKCFDLTCKDVYDSFGQPNEGIKYTVDLVDVVTKLAPEFLA